MLTIFVLDYWLWTASKTCKWNVLHNRSCKIKQQKLGVMIETEIDRRSRRQARHCSRFRVRHSRGSGKDTPPVEVDKAEKIGNWVRRKEDARRVGRWRRAAELNIEKGLVSLTGKQQLRQCGERREEGGGLGWVKQLKDRNRSAKEP